MVQGQRSHKDPRVRQVGSQQRQVASFKHDKHFHTYEHLGLLVVRLQPPVYVCMQSAQSQSEYFLVSESVML